MWPLCPLQRPSLLASPLKPPPAEFGLKRRDVPTLAQLARQDADDNEKPRHKPFKDYEPGYIHIDIKHLPQMPDEEQKRYLYVAIDLGLPGDQA